jgi:hypothetical protein
VGVRDTARRQNYAGALLIAAVVYSLALLATAAALTDNHVEAVAIWRGISAAGLIAVAWMTVGIAACLWTAGTN